jgi:hypothetical protein
VIAHPVQRRVAEYGVEFTVEIESFTVHYAGVQAEFSRGLDLRCTGIDSDYVASHRGELRGKHTVAAAKVQDALAGARCEQLDHGRAEFGDEAGIASIACRIPGLRMCHFAVPRRAAAAYQPFLFSAFGNSAFSRLTPGKSLSETRRIRFTNYGVYHACGLLRVVRHSERGTGLLLPSLNVHADRDEPQGER